MSKLIRLGDTLAKPSAFALSVDAIEYASRANAVLGIRDSGKTYTATMIAEQLMDHGIPFFAFDPIGRWRFLKVPGSRGGLGYPVVVAGGAAPDIELTPKSAPEIIRGAMLAGVSVVLDLYSVQLSKADWRAIVRGSIETILYEGDGHGQRHVFLEEASEFIPQRVIDGHTYAAVEKLARMGGNVGVGVTLINQRAEEVNKAVLELCDNLLLHRQRGKNSLVSLAKWLDAGNVKPPRLITDSLSELPTGQCWAWLKDAGQPIRIKVAEKHSFDPNRRAMASKGKEAADLMRHPPADFSNTQEALRRLQSAMRSDTAAQSKAARKQVDAIVQISEGKQVDEKEAQALRADNARLAAEVGRLQKIVTGGREIIGSAGGSANMQEMPIKSGQVAHTLDEIWEHIKRRLMTEMKVELSCIEHSPEITVIKVVEKIEASTSTLYGQCAMLIADSYFDQTRQGVEAWKELKRRGSTTAAPNVYKELDKLTKQGFLMKEDRGTYQAVKGMKINIEERRS